MAEVQRLGDMIGELMALFRERRRLEKRISEGNATPTDREELEALNRRLQK